MEPGINDKTAIDGSLVAMGVVVIIAIAFLLSQLV